MLVTMTIVWSPSRFIEDSCDLVIIIISKFGDTPSEIWSLFSLESVQDQKNISISRLVHFAFKFTQFAKGFSLVGDHVHITLFPLKFDAPYAFANNFTMFV